MKAKIERLDLSKGAWMPDFIRHPDGGENSARVAPEKIINLLKNKREMFVVVRGYDGSLRPCLSFERAINAAFKDEHEGWDNMIIFAAKVADDDVV